MERSKSRQINDWCWLSSRMRKSTSCTRVEAMPGAERPPNLNAFRKFALDGRFRLYTFPKIGTYAGNGTTFPCSQARDGSCAPAGSPEVVQRPHRFPGRVEPTRGYRGSAGTAAPPGRKPCVPVNELLPVLTFHVMNGAGTLAEHFYELFGEALADSSWSDRRCL